MSKLSKIQDYVIQYAEVISSITKIDVEVMDKNFIRVAGTGIFKDKINENMKNESFVYQEVLRTGETIIVSEPRKDKICKNCPIIKSCTESFEISTPIIYKGETVGVIGMISIDQEGRDIITSNLDDFLRFLNQVSEFISSKVHEYYESRNKQDTINTLEYVTNHIIQGVIIINKDNKIVNINDSAINQLGIGIDVIGSNIQIRRTGDYIESADEYELILDNKRFFIIGSIIDTSHINEEISEVILFSNLKNILKEKSSSESLIYPYALENIIGVSEKTLNLKDKIIKISKSSSTIMITGESGTGKELVASAIWKNSDRKDEPFIAVNCGAIPEQLLESELFGYVKGAFTGADSKGKIGKFELANNGIIFLDEIGDIPLYLQVKLLRVLQEREIVRLGSNRKIKLDIRVISATNKDLKKMVRENRFRKDLYYRLNVIPINIPPLRERREDIESLIFHQIKKYQKLNRKEFRYIDKEALNILTSYDWPGNVREIENVIEYMINMMDSTGILTSDTIPNHILNYSDRQILSSEVNKISDLEKREIKKALEIYGDSTQSKKYIAELLGIGIATLYRKIEKYDLN